MAAEVTIEIVDQVTDFFVHWNTDPRFCAAVMALPPDVDPFEFTDSDGQITIGPSPEVRAIAERLGG